MQPLRAQDQYRSWPGFTNPKAAIPVVLVRPEWEARTAAAQWKTKAFSRAYRFWRGTKRAMRRLGSELAAAPKRTLLEVVIRIPLLLLPLEPYRELLKKWTPSWFLLGALAVVGFFYGVWRRIRDQSTTTERLAKVAYLMHLIIEASRRHSREAADGRRPSKDDLRQTMQLVLQAIADVAVDVLQLPSSVDVHANLMIPMPVLVEGDPVPRHGCGIVAYNLKAPAEPAWSRVVTGDLGAGEALGDGRIQVVEDVDDPVWCGVFSGFRSKCFVSFPITAGSGMVVGVLNIDADQPMVFTRKNATKELRPVLAGALSLIAGILDATRIVSANPTTLKRRG